MCTVPAPRPTGGVAPRDRGAQRPVDLHRGPAALEAGEGGHRRGRGGGPGPRAGAAAPRRRRRPARPAGRGRACRRPRRRRLVRPRPPPARRGRRTAAGRRRAPAGGRARRRAPRPRRPGWGTRRPGPATPAASRGTRSAGRRGARRRAGRCPPAAAWRRRRGTARRRGGARAPAAKRSSGSTLRGPTRASARRRRDRGERGHERLAAPAGPRAATARAGAATRRRRRGRPSSRPAAVASGTRCSTAAGPSARGWATTAGAWAHARPWASRSSRASGAGGPGQRVEGAEQVVAEAGGGDLGGARRRRPARRLGLEHEHVPAGVGQQVGGDEPVGPGADTTASAASASAVIRPALRLRRSASPRGVRRARHRASWPGVAGRDPSPSGDPLAVAAAIARGPAGCHLLQPGQHAVVAPAGEGRRAAATRPAPAVAGDRRLGHLDPGAVAPRPSAGTRPRRCRRAEVHEQAQAARQVLVDDLGVVADRHRSEARACGGSGRPALGPVGVEPTDAPAADHHAVVGAGIGQHGGDRLPRHVERAGRRGARPLPSQAPSARTTRSRTLVGTTPGGHGERHGGRGVR